MIVVPYKPGIERLERRIKRVNEKVTDAVARDARRLAPVDTGELVGSIWSVSYGFTGQVWVGTDHWQPQEYGAGPHEILAHGPYGLGPRAATERWTHFYAPDGRVYHPGNPEIAFMRRALYKKRGLSGLGI